MMKIRILMLGIILVTIIPSLTGCAKPVTVEKKFTADEVNRIEIESNFAISAQFYPHIILQGFVNSSSLARSQRSA